MSHNHIQEAEAKLTISISRGLHSFIKSQAALQHTSVKALIVKEVLAKFATEHGYVCEYGYEHKYSEKFFKELEGSRKEDGKRKKYTSVEDLMKDLNSGI